MKNIIKRVTTGLATLALVAGFVAPLVSVSTASAFDGGINSGYQSAKGEGQPEELTAEGDGVFTIIVNVLLFIIGAISVIMLIIGGIRYTTSGGNQQSVEAAKNTILYAIIGLVVAILAYAVVKWVVGSLATGN